MNKEIEKIKSFIKKIETPNITKILEDLILLYNMNESLFITSEKQYSNDLIYIGKIFITIDNTYNFIFSYDKLITGEILRSIGGRKLSTVIKSYLRKEKITKLLNG